MIKIFIDKIDLSLNVHVPTAEVSEGIITFKDGRNFCGVLSDTIESVDSTSRDTSMYIINCQRNSTKLKLYSSCHLAFSTFPIYKL